MSGGRRLPLSVAAAFLVEVATSAVIAATTVATARWLGPEGRGVAAVAIALLALLGLLGNAGIGTANTHFQARGAYPTGVLLGNSLVAGLALGGAMSLAAELVFRFAPRLVPGLDRTMIAVVEALLPVSLVELYVSMVIVGTQRVVHNQLLALGARAAVLALVLFVLPRRPDAHTATVLILAYSPLRLIANVAYLWRRRPAPRPSFAFGPFRACVLFGLRSQLGHLLQFLNYRLDLFLVNAFAGAGAAGLYSVAVPFAELLWLPSQSVAYVLFPLISSRAGGAAGGPALTAQAARLALAATAAAALPLAAASFVVVPRLFGQAFAAAIPLFLLLLPGIVVFSTTVVLAADVAGRGRPEAATRVAFVSLVVTIAADLLLIPRLGAAGAALASTVSYGVAAAAMVLAFTRLTGLPASEAVRPRVADAVLAWRALSPALWRGAGR